MKKLCYICEATSGGVRKQLRALIDCFLHPEEGYEVHALLGHRQEPGFDEELAELEERGLCVQWVPHLQREIRPGLDLRAYNALKRMLRALAPDVVHTHSSKAGILGRLAANACGVPLIVHTPHIFPFLWSTGMRQSFYVSIEKNAAQRCHKIICVGQDQHRAALDYRIAPESHLVTIINGVDHDGKADAANRAAMRDELGLPADTGAPVVGMIARLAPQKGVEDFLKAAAAVLERRPDVTFVVIGAGSLEAQLRRLTLGLQLPPERVRLTGYRDHAERFLPAFDLLALTSLWEGLPYTVLEAMAAGVPVLATDIPGTREALAGGAGALSPPARPDLFATKIMDLLTDPAQLVAFAAAGRARVAERYTMQACLNGHRAVYRQEE